MADIRAERVFFENRAVTAALYLVVRAVDGNSIDVSADFSRVKYAMAKSPTKFSNITMTISTDTQVSFNDASLVDGDAVYVFVSGVGV